MQSTTNEAIKEDSRASANHGDVVISRGRVKYSDHMKREARVKQRKAARGAMGRYKKMLLQAMRESSPVEPLQEMPPGKVHTDMFDGTCVLQSDYPDYPSRTAMSYDTLWALWSVYVCVMEDTIDRMKRLMPDRAMTIEQQRIKLAAVWALVCHGTERQISVFVLNADLLALPEMLMLIYGTNKVS